MIKTKIIETTEKYDKDGKLVEKVTKEETLEDETHYNSECKCNLKSEEIINALTKQQMRMGNPIEFFF